MYDVVSIEVIYVAVSPLGEHYAVIYIMGFDNFILVTDGVELVFYDILLSFVQSQSLHSAQ